MVVGLGTGSTAVHAIRALGERASRENLSLRCIPTSKSSAQLGADAGLEIISLEDESRIDLTIDGADEVDRESNLIKGLGGALLREKIVAAATAVEIIIVDPSKLVDRLGVGPLPVEVLPFAWSLAQRHLLELAETAQLRRADSGDDFVTDNGNYILDCSFRGGIADARQTEGDINRIPGVVENGLFVDMVDLVIVGDEDGCRVIDGK